MSIRDIVDAADWCTGAVYQGPDPVESPGTAALFIPLAGGRMIHNPPSFDIDDYRNIYES